MKCFVHLGYDPVPKQADSPSSAIATAESHLSFIAESDDDDPSSKWLIRHRVDELYPDNFLEYNADDLLQALQKHGTVALQLVKYGADNVPVMGEICNIFTSEYEKKQDHEAEVALEAVEECLSHKHIDLHGEAMLPMRRRIPARKVQK